ncbi:outer membrane efflux protein [Cellulophaga algicola DSM 14237]|uniref:Outer membrane efflux protein n=1 Tax=Cellulophaga algicola (strain DSM 14237 / IC166 / ACAM 630) TaxID=688270 RepID=E6XDD7_CELAD|nr:TolC family protein [Cellulophaga algicola]ADV49069.1 outer membrane efflux protein [Cellulophaga algicola DSM 14237]
MKNHFLTFLALLYFSIGVAQETKNSFTLDEAISFALENNYSAINASRDIEDAQKQKWETIADGLPQINGTVGYQNQLKQPISLIPAEFFGGEEGTFAPVIFSEPQSMTATATLTQKIFDGSYIVGVQATKTFINYSKNNQEKTALDVKKAVVQAYGNVLLAEESVKILENNIATLEKNLFETKKIYENGLGDEESVEQLQITLSTVENQLKNAARLKIITLQMLNLTLGIATDNPTLLSDNLDDLAQQETDLAFVDTAFNLNNNVDYKMALNLNEQRALELKLQRSKALPTLNAFINFGSSAYSDQFNFFKSETEWFDYSIFGVDLNIPIFSSLKRSASTQRAKIALEKAKTQLTEAEQQIKLQLKKAQSDYILAVEQYATYKENLALAERIENKNQIKYSEGIASSFELRQAQLQLYDAQNTYLQSMVDVINTKTELEVVLNN